MSCGMQKPPFPVGFPWNQWFPWPGLPIAAAHLHQPAHVAGLHSHAEHREQLSSTLASGRRRKIWNLPGDFVRSTNKYRNNCQICLFLLGMSGLAHVGPKILIRNHEFSWSHWVHLEDFPPFSTHSAMDRYLTHREFSRTMSTFWRFLNFGTSVW